MIWLWISIAVASLAAGLWLSRPFLQRTRVEVDESDAAISIFRDQAEELRQDLKAGLISQEQFDAAEEEIEARTLEAARDMEQGIRISRPSRITAAALCAIIGAATIGLYAFIGSPSVADQPIAARKAEMLTRKAEAGDLNSRIEILIEKTKDNPDSFEDWWMLARSYSATGDHASAADAYRRASEMSGDRPSVLSAYAESLTLANGNKVPRAARVVFEQVLTRTPDPRARYYVALARAQAKDFEGALDDWAALAKDSAPNAPWMQLVRRDIVNMARFLKRDVKPYLPDASEAEVARASAKPEDRAALETRLADLGKALDEDPKNHKGWIERAQLLAALGRQEEAGEAIATGKSHFAAAPFVLGKLDETATALGLDLTSPESGVKGPSEEDIAAAGTLTEEQRSAMVEGMVEGLAAKLEDNPDNAEGWIMLIRSYSVIGKQDKAKSAYASAVDHFKSNPAVLARLKTDAASLAGVK